MIIAIIILSFITFISLTLFGVSFFKSRNQKKKLDERIMFVPGSKVLIPGYELVADKKDSFSVDYECDVIEISDTKIKVSAYDFSSSESIGKNPAMRNSIIGFMQNTWIDKDKVELIMDESDIRDEKLNKLLQK